MKGTKKKSPIQNKKTRSHSNFTFHGQYNKQAPETVGKDGTVRAVLSPPFVIIACKFHLAYVRVLQCASHEGSRLQDGVERIPRCGRIVGFLSHDRERNHISHQCSSFKSRKNGQITKSGCIYRTNDQIFVLVSGSL